MYKIIEVSDIPQKIRSTIIRLQRENQQLKQENKRLKELILLDPLTRIGNRRYLEQSLQQEYKNALRHQINIGFLLLDVDRFKQYNDIFGHLAGDQILIKIALSFQKVLRRPKDMIFRYGGEEFACLLPNTNLNGVINVGQRMLETARDNGITVSVGAICVNPINLNHQHEIIALADSAMYQGKNQGRDRMIVINLSD